MSEARKYMQVVMHDTLEVLDRLGVNDMIANATRASMRVHSPDAAIAQALAAYSETVDSLRAEVTRLREHGPSPIVVVVNGEVDQ